MTAVEWLEENILKLDNPNFTLPQWLLQDIEQAKEIHKQQIENAFEAGFVTQQWDKTKENKAEQYFKEKFNK
jgi:hypothetical protein